MLELGVGGEGRVEVALHFHQVALSFFLLLFVDPRELFISVMPKSEVLFHAQVSSVKGRDKARLVVQPRVRRSIQRGHIFLHTHGTAVLLFLLLIDRSHPIQVLGLDVDELKCVLVELLFEERVDHVQFLHELNDPFLHHFLRVFKLRSVSQISVVFLNFVYKLFIYLFRQAVIRVLFVGRIDLALVVLLDDHLEGVLLRLLDVVFVKKQAFFKNFVFVLRFFLIWLSEFGGEGSVILSWTCAQGNRDG